jgi:6-phosphogluconolactonase (cycloisomerase 2 family)
MYRNQRNRLNSLGLASLACVVTAVVSLFSAPAAAQPGFAHQGRPGAVYTMTNAADGNAILAYQRAASGSLMPAGTYPTGGFGAGEGLGNQGGVVLGAGNRQLFVVNAGSNDVSAFRIMPQGLMLTDVEPSLGERPVSIAVSGNLLYVLNAGGAGSIQGFTVSDDGDIMPIMDSMRPLSGAEVTAAAQVGFTPDGGVLVVTEKATSLIDTYVVYEDGTTTGPFVYASSGMTPFGFDFTSRGSVLVSEAFGGAPGMAAASSYGLAADGGLEVISGTVQSFQQAACWLVVDRSSRFAYTTNTPAGTISGYVIDPETDSIELLDEDGVTFDVGEGTGPLDAAFSANGRFLYVLNSGSHEIAVFSVDRSDGSLMAVQTLPGLPETANGMAAH